jgi:hypothetical protein
MDQASCGTVDPEVHFTQVHPSRYPGESRDERRVRVKSAKSVMSFLAAMCEECAVREICLERALEEPIQHGFRAGLTERQRRQMLKRRGGAPVA